MSIPSPSMRELARKVLAASQADADPHAHEAALVSERLRITLTRFAGADGFASLLRRALALASAEVPSLTSVRIAADGRLEGLQRAGADSHRGAADREAVAIAAHLLGLLVIFVGEPLTLKLVREAWPGISLDESDLENEADR